jgi:hypothetical protein
VLESGTQCEYHSESLVRWFFAKGSGGFLVKARGVVANITRRFNFYAGIVQ